MFPNLLVLAAGVVKSMLLLKLLVAPSVPNGRRPPVPMDDGRLLGKLILYGLGTNQRLWINWICFDGRGKNLASTWYVTPSCIGRTGKSRSRAYRDTLSVRGVLAATYVLPLEEDRMRKGEQFGRS